MLREPNNQLRISQDSNSKTSMSSSLYSNVTDETVANSAYSSGRFKKIVRQAATKPEAKQSSLQLNLYKSMGSASGNFGDSSDARAQTDQSASQLKLKRYKQTVSSFLRTATRDLREPLTILKTGLAVLKRLDKGDQNREIIEELERALVRTTNVIGTYLELDQHEALGRLELNCEPLSIYSVLEEEISKLNTVFPAETLSKIHIRNFVAETATMWADKEKIRQVFAVLLSRAVRYSANDGTVSVGHHSTHATEVIEISSQGRRIGADTIDALASPFLDRNGSKLTRLDLQAARKLVEVHHGKLLFDSEVQQGNRIWIVLPRAARARF